MINIDIFPFKQINEWPSYSKHHPNTNNKIGDEIDTCLLDILRAGSSNIYY